MKIAKLMVNIKKANLSISGGAANRTKIAPRVIRNNKNTTIKTISIPPFLLLYSQSKKSLIIFYSIPQISSGALKSYFSLQLFNAVLISLDDLLSLTMVYTPI